MELFNLLPPPKSFQLIKSPLFSHHVNHSYSFSSDERHRKTMKNDALKNSDIAKWKCDSNPRLPVAQSNVLTTRPFQCTLELLIS